jgi:hypothetical protein
MTRHPLQRCQPGGRLVDHKSPYSPHPERRIGAKDCLCWQPMGRSSMALPFRVSAVCLSGAEPAGIVVHQLLSTGSKANRMTKPRRFSDFGRHFGAVHMILLPAGHTSEGTGRSNARQGATSKTVWADKSEDGRQVSRSRPRIDSLCQHRQTGLQAKNRRNGRTRLEHKRTAPLPDGRHHILRIKPARHRVPPCRHLSASVPGGPCLPSRAPHHFPHSPTLTPLRSAPYNPTVISSSQRTYHSSRPPHTAPSRATRPALSSRRSSAKFLATVPPLPSPRCSLYRVARCRHRRRPSPTPRQLSLPRTSLTICIRRISPACPARPLRLATTNRVQTNASRSQTSIGQRCMKSRSPSAISLRLNLSNPRASRAKMASPRSTKLFTVATPVLAWATIPGLRHCLCPTLGLAEARPQRLSLTVPSSRLKNRSCSSSIRRSSCSSYIRHSRCSSSRKCSKHNISSSSHCHRGSTSPCRSSPSSHKVAQARTSLPSSNKGSKQ